MCRTKRSKLTDSCPKDKYKFKLYHKLIRKDDKGFWKAWCKEFCSSSLNPTTVLDGKYGDVDM